MGEAGADAALEPRRDRAQNRRSGNVSARLGRGGGERRAYANESESVSAVMAGEVEAVVCGGKSAAADADLFSATTSLILLLISITTMA